MSEDIQETIRDISNFLVCEEDIAALYLKVFEEPLNLNSLIKEKECSSSEKKLNFLSSLCLISDYTENQNRFFFPIDPQYSFPAIVLHKMWKTDSDLQTLSDLIKREDLVELNSQYKQCKKNRKRVKMSI